MTQVEIVVYVYGTYWHLSVRIWNILTSICTYMEHTDICLYVYGTYWHLSVRIWNLLPFICTYMERTDIYVYVYGTYWHLSVRIWNILTPICTYMKHTNFYRVLNTNQSAYQLVCFVMRSRVRFKWSSYILEQGQCRPPKTVRDVFRTIRKILREVNLIN